jgi:N-acetylglucosamine malate deacetylase 2
VSIEFPQRPLLFVAHPDDESIACGGLLQRVPESLVVFATDGAPPGCGLERIFGSLKAYGDLRAQEAARVFSHLQTSAFQRLTGPHGSHFGDQHLFEDLSAAATALRSLAAAFSPDAIVSHAYEGAHIDHDTCSFIAMHVAAALSLKLLEFPIYWLDPRGSVMRQQFRDTSATEIMELQLTQPEIECKKKMMAEYQSQRGTVATFMPGVAHERFRLVANTGATFAHALCRSYMYQERRPRFYHTRHHRLPAKVLLKKFAEFEDSCREQKD